MANLYLRRNLMCGTIPDTSPKIAEYGKYCNRKFSNENDAIVENSNWCYTEWYYFNHNNTGTITIIDNATDASHTWQIEAYKVSTNKTTYGWYYGLNNNWGNDDIIPIRIRFSIQISDIDTKYAYCETTGQIIFAGKNTQYYGYQNINDMS